MRFALLLFAITNLFACKEQDTPLSTCELVNIGEVGTKCDSLYAIGEHDKAAQLYFQTGEKNQSSELFVYAAWQYGEAGNMDSALIAIKQAVAFGMNSPFILEKAGIEEGSKNHRLRKEVDILLDKIKHKNASLGNFEIVTTPIDRFWGYFDQALNDTINAEKYLSQFICEGSNAIKDYYHIRYGNVKTMHRVMIKQNPEYYSYLKNHVNSGRLKKVSEEAESMMLKFSELYSKAVFPKAYLVPDLINGSGTLTELGLFVGVDMFAKSDSMPRKHLNSWQLNTITEFENMKFDLVHELMHFQQSYSGSQDLNLLLGKLIEEGVCDFLVSLLTEDNQVSSNVQRNLDYLKDPDNFKFVMSELKRDIYGRDLSKWMHNGGAIQDRPSNLGYTMGFLICKSYYDNSPDKEKAINELLNTNDFSRIIKESDFKGIL